MVNHVLVEDHPMLGIDAHFELGWVPPSPVPVPSPWHPHGVAATLRWIVRPMLAESVRCEGRATMQRGTDIQSGIPHIPIPLAPFCLLALMYTTFSGSKSHFGVATVYVEGRPIAVACLGDANINLNCGNLPTPTGLVDAPNTVLSRMTSADVWGGLAAMATDFAIQAVMSALIGKVGVNSWGEGLLGMLIGTPIGFSANGDGDGLVGIGGRSSSAASDWMRGWGETLGGDAERGSQTRSEAADAFDKIGDGLSSAPGPRPAPASPLSGWDIGGDLGKIFDRPLNTLDTAVDAVTELF